MRWLVAERMGWTLEYVDSLGTRDLLDAQAVWYGKAEARR